MFGRGWTMPEIPLMSSRLTGQWTCQDRARRGYLSAVSRYDVNLAMARQWQSYADHVIAGPTGHQVYIDRASEYYAIARTAWLDSIAYASI